MKSIYFLFVFSIGMVLLFTNCSPQPETQEATGELNVSVVWKAEIVPCPSYPPDTCLVVSVYKPDMKKIVAYRLFMPDDEVQQIKFPNIPAGEYIIALEQIDSLFRKSHGEKGTHEIIKFYNSEADSTSESSSLKDATIVKLTKNKESWSGINFVVY
ncbi:MAG: hypothetical protein GXO77_16275 [Calditrichaeota bacterium]|nr:hypothetical protein [Calditrichota bacterium]